MARRRNELDRIYGGGYSFGPAVSEEMARMMPETAINPEVGSKVVDLAVLDATKSFGKKIWRVLKLRDFSAYNLQTKAQTKQPLKTRRLTAELQAEEQKARESLRTMEDLEDSLRDLPERIRDLTETHKGNKERIGKLQEKLSELQSSIAALRAYISDFKQSEKIAGWEAEMARQTGWSRLLGRVKVVAARALYNDPTDDKFKKAFEQQAEIEEKIRELETAIKTEKGVDLTTSPVEENINALTPYDPSALSLGQFEARQQRLVDRLKACTGVPGDFDTGEKPLSEEKKKLSKQRKDRKSAEKAAKKFEAGRQYKLERLLWHEFGDKIALIRSWQARLPKMSHLGTDAYMSYVTSINNNYDTLKAEITKFKADNSISGLVEMLDYELGIRRPLRLNAVTAAPPVAAVPPLPGPAGGAPGGPAAGGGAGGGGPSPARAVRPRPPATTRRMRPRRPAPAASPATSPAAAPAAPTSVLAAPASSPAAPVSPAAAPPVALPSAAPDSVKPNIDMLTPQQLERVNVYNRYLSYSDIFDLLGHAEKQKRLDAAQKRLESGVLKPSEEKYSAELVRIMNDRKYAGLLGPLCIVMRESVLKLLTDFGISPRDISPWSKSYSWAMWDIVKQRYLLSHRDESNSKYRLADPFEDLPIRNEIIDRMFGWEMANNYSKGISTSKIDQLLNASTNEAEKKVVKEILDRAAKNGHVASWEYTVVGSFLRNMLEGSASLPTPPSPPTKPPVVPPTKTVKKKRTVAVPPPSAPPAPPPATPPVAPPAAPPVVPPASNKTATALPPAAPTTVRPTPALPVAHPAAPPAAPTAAPTAPIAAPTASPEVKKMEVREILAPSEIIIIGDLHGNLEALKQNLLTLKALDIGTTGEWHWTGGNRRLMIMGDILADRVPEGLQIMNKLRLLSQEAKQQGGEIVTMFGNHEDMAMCFLTGRKTAGGGPERDQFYIWRDLRLGHDDLWQGMGALELVKDFTQIGQNINNIEDIKAKIENNEIPLAELYDLNEEVLRNMQNSPEGKAVLEQMCQMKLVHLEGKNLFFHTEPSEAILETLTEGDDLAETVESLNFVFQENLKQLLLVPGADTSGHPEFTRLCSTFLHPDSRDFSYKINQPRIISLLAKLNALGVERIINGHSRTALPNYRAGDVEIVNVDFGYGMPNEDDQTIRSVAYIDTDNRIHNGKTEAENIEHYDPAIPFWAGWIGQVTEKTGNYFPMAKRINEMVLASPQKAELIASLMTPNLYEFMNASLTGKLTGGNDNDPLLAKADGIFVLMEFYNDFVKNVPQPLSEVLEEMKSFKKDSLEDVMEEWIAKEEEQVAKAEKPVEPVEERFLELPLSQDLVQKESLEELKKTVHKNLTKVFGLSDVHSEFLWRILQNLEIAEPKKFEQYIKLICLYADVLEFLFTLKLPGNILVNQRKSIKALPAAPKNQSDRGNSKVFAVLDKAETVRNLAKIVRAPEGQETLLAALSHAKNLYMWFKSLK